MAKRRQPPDRGTPGSRARLLKQISKLDEVTCHLLETMVDSLSASFLEDVAADTDVATPAFARNFRERLQIHHATHEEVFKKKTFEFAFKGASIAAGKTAVMDPNDSNPGYDAIVSGTKYSLKTEAGVGISPRYVTISKLMEARWIRECRTGEDFQAGMAHLLEHFSHYHRVLMLRALRVTEPFIGVRYDLIEIPLSLLNLISSLRAQDFAPRRDRSGGSSAIVKHGEQHGFRLVLDGSVEKVTIARLDVSLCRRHATWTVQSQLGGGEEESTD